MTTSDPLVLVERSWESDMLDSTEDFTLSAYEPGFRLAGRTLILHDGIRVEIDYAVETRPDWSTRSGRISIPALAASFEVEVDDRGMWMIDGDHRAELDGCMDLDLGWTPSTNTLPIRRLPLATGVPRTARVTWLKWPELVFIPAEQTYTKRGDDTFTYASDNFSADLEVDEHGVVITYGHPPIWRESRTGER